MALEAPATRVASRRLGPVASSCCSPDRTAAAARRGEYVGEHVGQVGDRGKDGVVGVGVDRDRASPEPVQQVVQPFVQHARGGLRWRQVPGGAVKEVRSRVLDPGALCAGQGMSSHEPGVGVRGHDGALGRSHVADHAIVGSRRQHLVHHRNERAHRHGDECRIGAIEGLLGRSACMVEGAALDGVHQDIRGTVRPPHLGAQPFPGAQPDRATDQTDPHDGDPHPRRRYRSARRSLTAPASRSSTSTVVSQSIQPSVIDWP